MYGQNPPMFPMNMPPEQRLQYMEQMYGAYGNQPPMPNSNNQPMQPYNQQPMSMQQPMVQNQQQQIMQQPQKQPMQQVPQENYIKCRPVTNIDEARAAMIDFDGTLYIFPDISHQMIYTKSIGNDGNPSFKVFVEQPDIPQQQMMMQQPQFNIDELKSSFVGANEFNTFANDLNIFKQTVYGKLTDITEKYNLINELLGGKPNEQQ